MAPNQDLTSVMLVGEGKLRMLLMNWGVGFMPLSVTKNPRKFTSLSPNWNFLGLKVQPSLEDLDRNSQIL